MSLVLVISLCLAPVTLGCIAMKQPGNDYVLLRPTATTPIQVQPTIPPTSPPSTTPIVQVPTTTLRDACTDCMLPPFVDSSMLPQHTTCDNNMPVETVTISKKVNQQSCTLEPTGCGPNAYIVVFATSCAVSVNGDFSVVCRDGKFYRQIHNEEEKEVKAVFKGCSTSSKP